MKEAILPLKTAAPGGPSDPEVYTTTGTGAGCGDRPTFDDVKIIEQRGERGEIRAAARDILDYQRSRIL